MPRARPPVLSGSWYPGEPAALTRTVHSFLATEDRIPTPRGKPVLAVAPHAGYAYSGVTAGRLYALLRNWHYERVFILAPSHRHPIRQLALSGSGTFALPGGEVLVDQVVVTALARHPAYAILNDAHAAEHAVEIQLPFLREVFGTELRIVPLLVPAREESWLREAALALTPWCDGRSLFLVSTDFTHYGVAYGYVPFAQPSAEKLAELDQGAIDHILDRDPGGLLAYGERTGITMCGIQAAAFALSAPLPTGGEVACVAYSRSGDQDGDYHLSVSYASLLLCAAETSGGAEDEDEITRHDGNANVADQTRHDPEIASGKPETTGLTPEEKEMLLQLARFTLRTITSGQDRPDPQQWLRDQGRQPSSRLVANRGAFVTLTKADRLRGCIGYIEGVKPLLDTVAENAEAAARRDPRFPPVKATELDELRVEISILSPLTEINDPASIVLGRDGIVLEKGPHRAVFLPQVAVEQGWDLHTTLDHLAMKAGLQPQEWHADARLQVFQADVFAEKPPD